MEKLYEVERLHLRNNVQHANSPTSTIHLASQGRTNYCRPAYHCTFSCVSPAADGTKLLACWQHLMLVPELHLPSKKDNQLTGVFNLKYSHWPMQRSAQPLHKGKDWTWLQSLTGEHVSSVLRVCRQSLLSDSELVMAHDVIWFRKFSCTAGSVKGLCRRLISSSQHRFAEPTVAWNVFSGHCFFFQWRWEA